MSRTFYIKTCGPLTALRAHFAVFARRPLSYCSSLAYALSIRRGLLYFVEAVVFGHWMFSRNLGHVHIHFASTVGLIAVRIFPVSMSNSIHGPAEFEDPIGFRLPEKIRRSLFVRAISSFGRSQLMRVSDYADWEKIEVRAWAWIPHVSRPGRSVRIRRLSRSSPSAVSPRKRRNTFWSMLSGASPPKAATCGCGWSAMARTAPRSKGT